MCKRGLFAEPGTPAINSGRGLHTLEETYAVLWSEGWRIAELVVAGEANKAW